jgi:hypothetical protein
MHQLISETIAVLRRCLAIYQRLEPRGLTAASDRESIERTIASLQRSL